MRRWPDCLPTPSFPGFGLSPFDKTNRTDMEVGLARVGKRGQHDRLEAEMREFHERVRNGYRTLAAAERARFVTIDGEAKEDDVERQVLAAVAARGMLAGHGVR